MKKNRKHYLTPNLKVVAFKVENGFAGSSTPVNPLESINFKNSGQQASTSSSSSTWSTSTTNTDGWFN